MKIVKVPTFVVSLLWILFACAILPPAQLLAGGSAQDPTDRTSAEAPDVRSQAASDAPPQVAPDAPADPPPDEREQAAAPPALDLSLWRGRVVLLDFWASWCAPCQQSFPWMVKMKEAYGERGLVVVAVDLDEDPEAAAPFLGGVRGEEEFVHVKDPEGRIAEAYGLTVMPTSVLFDRAGRPVYRHEGFHPERKAEYERRIVELIENRGPAEALTIAPAAAARLGVRPWERGVLADPIMRLKFDPLETEFDDHIYFSKEASSGGRGFGGGGCGCN